MIQYTFVATIPMLGLLTWAALQDLQLRRIRNWLTGTIVLSGLLFSFVPYGIATPMQSLAGLLIGLSIPFLMFAMGALGAGDVKLLAGVGAWVGAAQMLWVLALTAIVGGLFVILQSLWQRRTLAVLRNTLIIALNLLHIRQLGLAHVKATGQSCQCLEKTVPYAIPIWIATVLTLFTPVSAWLMGRSG